jgi:fatty-acyl-CoA synthase
VSLPPYRDVTVGDLLSRLAGALPDSEALVYADGPRYTFATLEREARVIARGLIALGVEPGERVVLWARSKSARGLREQGHYFLVQTSCDIKRLGAAV